VARGAVKMRVAVRVGVVVCGIYYLDLKIIDATLE
jgi:hypothetical protein